MIFLKLFEKNQYLQKTNYDITSFFDQMLINIPRTFTTSKLHQLIKNFQMLTDRKKCVAKLFLRIYRFSWSGWYPVRNSRAREHAVQLRVQPGRAASSAARCVTSQTHRRRTPAELSPQSLQICGWSCLNNCGNVTREHLSCKTGCNGV